MTAREDCVFQRYYILARHLFHAGFFATHNNLFFDISFLYACLPPLKNDGTRCYCEEVDRAGCQERGGDYRIEIVNKRTKK